MIFVVSLGVEISIYLPILHGPNQVILIFQHIFPKRFQIVVLYGNF